MVNALSLFIPGMKNKVIIILSPYKNGVNLKIQVATEEHLPYVDTILQTIEDAAKVRGTGIAKRSPDYVALKITKGKPLLRSNNDEFAGFCYIESWGHNKFVANSGLIVVEKFRGHGLAKDIKKMAFDLSRKKFPMPKYLD
jgi:RimJ/RimL family protein N-acetyltransferase